MKVLVGLEHAAECTGALVSIGNFDGVHLGHRRMLSELVECARRESVPALVCTFQPHPMELLRPGQAPPPLTTLARRCELLDECHVDAVLVFRTDARLLQLSPSEFFEQVLRGQLQVRGLVEGPNFTFGRNRAGTLSTLAEYCESAGMRLETVPPVEVRGVMVSSSEVRQRLRAGDVSGARELLASPYRLEGRVARGAQRGRLLGFPTANLEQIETLLPLDGVYAGRALWEGRAWAAAIHIGPNITFAEQARRVEVHLLDFAGDLYGATLSIEFWDRIRASRQFAGPDELTRQLHDDIARVRELVTT